MSQDETLDSLAWWKRQCARAEKTVKSLSETNDYLRRELLREQAQSRMYEARALAAEKVLRNHNYH